MATVSRVSVVVLSLLVAGVLAASAADYHALADLDGDGKADPCPNPAHRTYYSTDTVNCGGLFDIDGDGVDERLYCDLQACFDDADAPGDSCEVHQATWNEDRSTEPSIQFVCNGSGSSKVLAAIPGCPSCTNEAARRYFRAAVMNGAVDPTGAVVLDPSKSIATVPLVVGKSGSDNCDFVTVKGLKLANIQDLSCDRDDSGNWMGAVAIKGDADRLVVDGLDVSIRNYDSIGECHGYGNTSGMALVTNIAGSPQDIDDVEIKNLTGNICSLIGVKMTPSVSSSANFNNWAVHDNSVNLYADIGGASHVTLGEWKGFVDLYVYNNHIRCPNFVNGGSDFKTRASRGKLVVFNNVIEGCKKGVWHIFQDDTFSNVYIFNNTVRGAGETHFNDPPGVLYFYNNSLLWDPALFFTTSEVIAALGPGDHHGFNHWDSHPNNTPEYRNYSFSGDTTNDSGGHICTDSDACGANGNYQDCVGRTTCDPANDGTDAANAYRLLPGSVLIDAGTNNPVGQGPNVCSFTPWSGFTIDCTKDRDGDDRTTAGTTWDIGADEFAGSPPVDPPPDVTNLIRTDK